MANRIPGAEMDNSGLVTPYFMHLTVEDVPQSELKREPVMKTREVVQIRFAGDKNYSPIVPVDAMYIRDGSTVITYAERFADQYQEFLTGAAQTSAGTPLEKLTGYGITQAQISLCRALKIYSIEAIHHLEGQNLKSLGMQANALKDMAERYMADRAKGQDTAAEMAALRAELEALKAARPLPKDEFDGHASEEIDAYAKMTDDELKAAIADKIGRRPAGNPNRETLLNSLRELENVA